VPGGCQTKSASRGEGAVLPYCGIEDMLEIRARIGDGAGRSRTAAVETEARPALRPRFLARLERPPITINITTMTAIVPTPYPGARFVCLWNISISIALSTSRATIALVAGWTHVSYNVSMTSRCRTDHSAKPKLIGLPGCCFLPEWLSSLLSNALCPHRPPLGGTHERGHARHGSGPHWRKHPDETPDRLTRASRRRSRWTMSGSGQASAKARI